ncbi:MAG: 23S rRNA (guanine(745)-N(1))-methyltransferase [Thalassotalea sp.]
MSIPYLCPLCSNPITPKGQSYICLNNHSFDQAKEGYLNLLPVQFKQSKNPGDNKAMVNARRDFLAKGYYQPLADKLVSLYQEFCIKDAVMLDAGCGEGFYTHQHQQADNQVFGIDIAKEAIKKAAKKYKTCQFSVGTLSHLPFADQQINWILSIYAPILETEFSRVLAENGYLLTVTPAKDHLTELKQQIYREVKAHDETREPIQALTLVHQEHLNYQMQLSSGQDTLNLLMMTPFAFKATAEVLAKLSAVDNFSCQADFLIKIYQKK